MHELSIAQNIVDIIGQYVTPVQAPDVRLVKIRIGPLAGIVADSLDFCFGAIVGGTPFENARLDIEQTPVESRCVACGEVFTVEGAAYLCPGCGSAEVRLISGTELQVVEIELADRHAESS
jgi:hydrogenase nickel incorporation protein HypA/HybF